MVAAASWRTRLAHLGRGQRAEHGAGNGEGGADDVMLTGLGRARDDIIGEDDQHAEQADEHRRPAVDANSSRRGETRQSTTVSSGEA